MSHPGPYGGPTPGQGPWSPPGGHNPYGAPPPPGYGQYPPQQPPQYPPQQYPQQYPPGPPDQGGAPPPRKPRLWIPLLIVGLVVVLAGGGTAAWFLMAGGGGSTLAGKVAWKTPEPSPAAEIEPLGSWSAVDVVVQVTTRRITAWSKSSGAKKWEITPPVQPGQGEEMFCGVSSSTEKGLGAVTYGSKEASSTYGESCFGVMLVDLRTGQPRWNVKTFTEEDDGIPQDFVHVDIVGNRVVYAFAEKVSALRTSDGNNAWTYNTNDCLIQDHGSGSKAVVVVQECDDENMSMLMLDPATGKVKSSTSLPKDKLVDVVSANPVVLSVSTFNFPKTTGNYVVFDERGNEMASIPQGLGPGSLDKGMVNTKTGASAHAQYRVLVSNGMLVTATKPERSGSVRSTNEIVAFDLETGERRWSKSLGPGINGVPFAATEGGVLAVNGGTREKPSKVVRLSWEDGAITPVSKPYSSLGVVLVGSCALHWDGDAVYGVNMSGNDIAPKAFALK